MAGRDRRRRGGDGGAIVSISGRCQSSGEYGIAIASSPVVAARCAHARAGAGVVAAQNITDPRLGQRGVAAGLAAKAMLAMLRALASQAECRRLVVLDRHGPAAVSSDSGALDPNAPPACGVPGNP